MMGYLVKMEVDYAQIKRITRRFSLARKEAKKRILAITYLNALELLWTIQANAPIETGRYVGSWRMNVNTRFLGGIQEFVVYTFSPYAMRLEYGFTGIDSLGRHYSQAPQPHIRPAMAIAQAHYKADLEEYLGELASK